MLGHPQQPLPANTPMPGFAVWWTKVGRIAAKLIGDRSHCDLVIQFRGGKIELVRVNQTLLPNQIPDV